MVFGFGKGKMTIALNKVSFTPGEKITGTVKMQLKKPVRAKGVFVSLIAEQKTTNMGGPGFSTGGANISFGSSKGSKTQVERIIDVKVPLAQEGQFGATPYEYTFEIAVPAINQATAPEGVIGGVAKAASFMAGRASAMNWFVEAKLDVPKGFDVSAKQAITVV